MQQLLWACFSETSCCSQGKLEGTSPFHELMSVLLTACGSCLQCVGDLRHPRFGDVRKTLLNHVSEAVRLLQLVIAVQQHVAQAADSVVPPPPEGDVMPAACSSLCQPGWRSTLTVRRHLCYVEMCCSSSSHSGRKRMRVLLSWWLVGHARQWQQS